MECWSGVECGVTSMCGSVAAPWRCLPRIHTSQTTISGDRGRAAAPFQPHQVGQVSAHPKSSKSWRRAAGCGGYARIVQWWEVGPARAAAMTPRAQPRRQGRCSPSVSPTFNFTPPSSDPCFSTVCTRSRQGRWQLL